MPSNLDRAPDRQVNVIFRTSREGREEIKARANARGVSVQTYLESIALGRPLGADRPSGPTMPRNQELPLTG